MSRSFVWSVVTLAVAGSCLLEYGGVWLLSRLPVPRQNRIFVIALAIGGLALALFRSNIVVTNYLVLAAALVLGTLLSRQLGSIGALSTFLLVGAVVDLISTGMGPTRWLVDYAEQAHGATVLRFLAVSIWLRETFVPVIGMGDLLFFTVCVSTAKRLGWPNTPALLVPLAGLLSGLAAGLFIGLTPGLPFLAAAMLLYSQASRWLRPESSCSEFARLNTKRPCS